MRKPQTRPLPPIPPSFHTLKSSILTSLSTPTSSYTDASPKGTLDEPIVPLLDRLNALEGVVTTSSCSGRVSVFVEGGGDYDAEEGKGADEGMREGKEKRVPGGKGIGGRWVWVSHERVNEGEGDWMGKWGLMGKGSREGREGEGEGVREGKTRVVRFAFEPMILHIATASLAHARPLLAAALSAGFRESGIQSLKNLSDPSAIPMLAVRSAGLAFESIIGIVITRQESEQIEQTENTEETIVPLFSESYLHLLIKIANERFAMNEERVGRFERLLFAEEEREKEKKGEGWEDGEVRRERMRREGLERRGERGNGGEEEEEEGDDILIGEEGLEGIEGMMR
ncbi:MAG: hypothetical protein Q9220_000069 [cf. Caloplaca sp. 1 TL-2023]